MHILHISTPKSWRGGEQQVAYLLEELREKGIEQSVLCPQDSVMKDHAEKENFTFYPFKKVFSLNPLVGKKIKQICISKKVDIIHVHDSHGHSFAWLSAVLFNNKTPIVISRRVDFPIKNKKTSLWKYNHTNVKKIICVSEAVKSIASPAIQNKEILTVVYDGIDLNKFSFSSSNILRKEFNIPADILLIGNVAAIAPHKDYFTFVNVVERLVSEKFPARYFIIGGDGGEKEKIEEYIQEKGLEKNVILTGFRSDIPQILPELDAFLFTSKTEGLGTSVLDALCSNVPVVTTRAGGISEYIKNKKNGLSSPIQDDEDLANNVKNLFRKNSIRLKIIEEGRKTVQNFSKQKMAEGTLKIYQKIIQNT